MSTVTASGKALIEDHLHIVGYHVSDMLVRVPSQVTRDDLASAGYLALTRAAMSYDPDTGVPFTRFAAIRIKGALIDELRSMDWLPRGTRRKVREYTKTIEQITTALGRKPQREEIAAALGVDVSEVDAISDHAGTRVLSIDAYDGGLVDVLPSQEISPEAKVVQAERYLYLREAVRVLPERMSYVIEQIFFHERAVADIAEELEVTQSRVSQLRSEAMVLLRDGLNTHLDPQMVPVEQATGVVARRRAKYFEEIGQRVQQRPAPIRSAAAFVAAHSVDDPDRLRPAGTQHTPQVNKTLILS